MKLKLKTLLTTAASLGLVASLTTNADACGGRGGRSYAPRYYPQQHVQPYCPPKQVAHYPPQHIPPQHNPPQHIPQQHIPQQPFPQQQFPGQQAVAQPNMQPQFAGQQPVGQQPIAQHPVGQSATQQVFGQQPIAGQPQAAPQPATQNGVVATPISNPAQGNRALPQNTSPVAQSAPAAAQPAPATIQTAPAQNSAERMALEALSGIGGDPSAPAASQPEPAAQSSLALPVGQFVARLESGATIRLTLQQGGAFVWTATNQGKDSSFQGQFSLDGGSLKLLRSNDNQKLEGAFAQTQNGFTFRLGGDKPTHLTFVRG